MEPVLKPISNLLHVNDDIFGRAFEGVTDELARQRMQGGNRFLWVAAHMVVPRSWLIDRLGGSVEVPWAAAFDRGTEPPEDDAHWPSVADVTAKWREVALRMHELVERVSAADLEKPIQNFPSYDGTVLGGISLMAFHDAYHIGQLGHLRRRLGLPRMVG